MARTPLGPVSALRINKRRELLLTDHTFVVGLVTIGKSYTKIERLTGFDEDTVRKIIARALKRGSFHDKPRGGHPKVYTNRDERRILRAVHIDPGVTYLQLKTDLNLSFLTRTIRRLLKEYNIIR